MGRSRGILAARPSRHRRGAGLRLAERHHQRRPVRPRVRGKVDHRLRRHCRACAGVDRGTRRRDLPDPGGRRHRVGPPVRFGQQLGHPVGPCVRPEHERHGLEPGRRRPDGHLRQHRHAGRLASGAQRLQRVARFGQRREVGRPRSRQEKGDHALRVQHRRRGLHPPGRVRSGAALHGDGRAVPHQDVVRPVHQRAGLRRHGRAAPVQGAEGDPLHRVCRSVPDAHGRGAGRRGHARGHELRAQLRPFVVDARAHAFEGDQLLRGQVRRRDHRGAGPSPEPRCLPVGHGRGLRELVPHTAVRPGVVRHQGIGEQPA